ncbi:MAG TPA: nuclear transport factor 2 family protein [Salinimicrobium sp.]|nr:nuclear transport factor 2 family protein [Salinimicrobium sp.]
MKNLIFAFLVLAFISCEEKTASETEAASVENPENSVSVEEKRKNISELITSWHEAAAAANFDTYFDKMSADGVFIGTDATENWQNEDFRKYSQPHFESGEAWDFTALERNIYIAENGEIAWFDELLETPMGICRGSGVVSKASGSWKIKHYVLSMVVPNEVASEVIKTKSEIDSIIISQLKL